MVIGITGLKGTGKTKASIYLRGQLGSATVIHVDDVYEKFLLNNTKLLTDIYGIEVINGSKIDEEIYTSSADKVNKVFALSKAALEEEEVLDRIHEAKKNYDYVIIEYDRLPELARAWESCDFKMYIMGSPRFKRYMILRDQKEQTGSKANIDLDFIEAVSPDYSKINYDMLNINTYESSFYEGLSTLAMQIRCREGAPIRRRPTRIDE